MYDELVKRLRECASGECFNCSQYTETTNASVCSKELMKQAADAIEELSVVVRAQKAVLDKFPKWIPVSERMPEEYVNVLCHLRSIDRQSEYYSIDHLMEDGQWWKVANSWKFEVTHWMPIPKGQEEE